MVKFQCRFCGYSLEKDLNPKNCPYCSKKDALEKEENAEELLSEI
jgi:rubrerythrin